MGQDRFDITYALKWLISYLEEKEIVTPAKDKEVSWNKVKQRLLQPKGEQTKSKIFKENETFI